MMSLSPGRERLPFTMPAFLRLAWSSDGARAVWLPRLKRVIRAVHHIEWASTLDDIRQCALVRMSLQDYEASRQSWTASGLTAVVLNEHGGDTRAPHSGTATTVADQSIAIGRPPSVAALQAAWAGQDSTRIGELLGYPPCCVGAFTTTFEQEHLIDPTWDIAINSQHAAPGADVLEIVESAVTNTLWRWIGIQPIPHAPCRFDCRASAELGTRLMQAGMDLGYGQEIEWLQNVLDWPVEWSALHGIAEIRTPILKIATKTDATANKLVVRWIGHRYPSEGATGITFPYLMPERLAKHACGSDQRQHLVQIQRRVG